MEQLNNLDVVFMVIVGISILVAIIRGITKELLSITGWVLAAVAVYYLLPIINPITKNYISSDILSNLVSGMAILIIFCVFWLLTADKISSQIRASKLSALDRILGFVFGLLRGVVVVILIQIMISTLIPEESEKGIFAESKYFKLAGENAAPIKNLIPEKWLDDIKNKSESFGLAKKEDKEKVDNKDDNKQEDNSISEGLELLEKSGEELFDELVKPKTEGEVYEKVVEENSGYDNEEMSDLDRLMDVLEDRVVTTEETDDNLLNDVTNKVIDKVAEKVADKVVNQ